MRRQQCLRFELQSVVTQATLTIQGYQTTPGDEGTRPLITTATNSTDLFTTSSNSGTQIWDNLQMTNTASTKATGIRQLSQHGTSQSWTVRNCVLSGFAEGLDSDNNGATYDVSWIHVIGTEISNCTVLAIGCNTGNLVVLGCNLHDCPMLIYAPSSNNVCYVGWSQLWNATGTATSQGAIYFTGSQIIVEHCNFYNDAGYVLNLSSIARILLWNNVLYGNNQLLLSAPSGNVATYSAAASRNNAVGGNTTTWGSPWSTIPGNIALTANPWVSPSTGNFSLNSTTGGGLSCKEAGFPNSWPDSAATGYLDIGPVQSQGAAGAGNSAYAFVS